MLPKHTDEASVLVATLVYGWHESKQALVYCVFEEVEKVAFSTNHESSLKQPLARRVLFFVFGYRGRFRERRIDETSRSEENTPEIVGIHRHCIPFSIS